MSKKTILVVDDDKDLVASVKTYLETRGYAVRTAYDGATARAEIARDKPDLLVLDVMMEHDTAGFNLAYALRNDPATRRLPVVLLTGFMQHLDEKYSKFEYIQDQGLPAAKYFEKPVALKDLADSIGKLIAEREALEASLAEAQS